MCSSSADSRPQAPGPEAGAERRAAPLSSRPTPSVRILPVTGARALRRFVELPHRHYRGDRGYVPQPNLLQRQLLRPGSNPFLRRSEIALFLAVNETGQPLGRIAAIHNSDHLQTYRDATGFFGFFDAIDHEATARALVSAAGRWLQGRGLRRMVGPENLTTNDSAGILTSGFSEPPVILMPYNFPYYARLLEASGLRPLTDLVSYRLSHTGLPADAYQTASKLEARLGTRGVLIRPLRFDRFAAEIGALRRVYNEANADGWGFVPLDEPTFRHMASDLRQLVGRDGVWLAEEQGRLVGFLVCVPDYNQVFRRMKEGRLFPWGWWPLLTGRRSITAMRVMILGVLPSHRRRGIDWCLYARAADYARRHGMPWAEAGYVMEDNGGMHAMLRALGGTVVKTYRLYQGDLHSDERSSPSAER
jgi:GNAT superfamily N-acetyltransferase